ncbi:ferritin-like domain-containing protein (plasmid) [Nostoc sp. UHCC 0302]|uniref:ferritin-like domain-containing protein n=1 Tax=Nostoc sp. UHCC 0302 TaxID=3134896 RepID=UPI00311CD4BB
MSTDNQVKTREDLLYLLSQASELEHSLACQYLFTAFSLKESTDEGVSQAQLNKINRWRRTINGIAVEEMLHLALASNLLTAIGGAPYFRRANFPQAKTYTSLKLSFKLAPFNETTLNRYICFELPNNFDNEEQRGNWTQFCQSIRDEELLRLLAALPQPLLPRKLEYNTIGELYGLIRQGFQTIGQKLFIGPPEAQATGIFPGMIQVKDLDSAIKAIDLIIMQGEGSPAQRDDSHFAKFTKVREEYLAELQNDPNFQPARPVIENPLLSLQQDNTTSGANIITDTLSRDVVSLILNPEATWCQFRIIDDPRTNPGGLFALEDDTEPNRRISLGLVDDVCDGLVTCSVQGLKAIGRIVVGPPDYAPDRRPITSLADGLSDRVSRQSVSELDYVADMNLTTAEVGDLLERVLETMEGMNLDFQNDRIRSENRNIALAQGLSENTAEAKAFPQIEQILGRPLPLTEFGRQRHRRFVSLEIFEDRLRENPELIAQWIREPMIGDRYYDRKMPALMRGSDRYPMHITRRQYDLLVAWANRLRRDAEAGS